MAADTRVKVGSSWRQISADGIYGNVGGSWQQVDFGYANVGGTWRTVYISDKTAPAAPTNTKVAWENGGLRITWTNPVDADYDRMELVIYPSGEPYLSTPEVSGAPGAAGSYLFTSSYIRNYQSYDVWFRPIDENGNKGNGSWESSMEFTGQKRGRTPSPIAFRPTDSGTWDEQADLWRTNQPGGPTTVVQGASISRNNIGVYFYGTQFWTYLRGASITAARLDLVRQNTTGAVAAVYPNFAWSADVTSKASNPEPVGQWSSFLQGAGMTRYSSPPPYGQTVLTSTFRNAIGANTLGSSLRALRFSSLDQTLQPGLGNVSNSYMTMFGYNTGPYFGLYPGSIYVEHSG